MTVQIVGSEIFVTLSARNLQHLNQMLANGAGSSLSRRSNGAVLHVSVEPDEVHYANREAGPGWPGRNS